MVWGPYGMWDQIIVSVTYQETREGDTQADKYMTRYIYMYTDFSMHTWAHSLQCTYTDRLSAHIYTETSVYKQIHILTLMHTHIYSRCQCTQNF